MKKNGLSFFFIVFTSIAFGQQFLWTTFKDSATKYVPIENVTEKVLEFYDHYQFYFDGSGYSKDGFFKMFEASKSFKNSNASRWKDLKNKIYKIDSLTVIAFKSNLGQGSVILVMCISKENVNLISFSNNYEQDAILTYSTDRGKFSKWFKTLLD
ncbi:MAG: hypothetical protein BGP13_25290 [Sphingobacteriales bacterium 40-81]|nr:MAG: hypothetical protein BGP13_25290 [Sphingobacteriales bacterium 40-81]